MLTFANPGDQISLITIEKSNITAISAYKFPSLYCTDMKWSFEFSDYDENVIYVAADSNKLNEPIICKFLLSLHNELCLKEKKQNKGLENKNETLQVYFILTPLKCKNQLLFVKSKYWNTE